MNTLRRIPLLYPIRASYQVTKFVLATLLLLAWSAPKGLYSLGKYSLGFWTCHCCSKTYWANHEHTVCGYFDERKHCRACGPES